MSRPIADYAIIGDTRSSALIDRSGSIDWLCWPRHDSPAVFTKLLDEANGGCCALELDAARCARAYLPRTNILETCFAGAAGSATLTDFMSLVSRVPLPDTGPDSVSQHCIVRLLRATHGEVRGRFRCRLTPDYGRARAQCSLSSHGATLHCGPLTVVITSSVALQQVGGELCADFHLHAHDTAFFAVQRQEEDPASTGIGTLTAALDAYQRTCDYWREWSASVRYQGEQPAAVLRSALTLKLLTYAPTGGIVAAATTSLPEAVPGDRNFDYRFNWIRDASFTMTAFCNLGLLREASEYLRFLARVDASQGRALRVLYGIDGEPPADQELPHLPGWNGTGPVHIGNAANQQKQVDIYGEFLIAIHAYLAAMDFTAPPDLASRMVPLITHLAEQAIHYRDLPDAGIWESRGAPQQYLHTKALLWTALDRAAKTLSRLDPGSTALVRRWRAAADALRADYEARGWNEARQAYTQAYGSDLLDAAVMRPVLFGALDPRSPRVAKTLAAIERELAVGDLLYRNRDPDGFQGREATFTACAFWRVGVLALMGHCSSARALLGRLVQQGNDVGLYAEEIDAISGEQRGNVPQGFAHMALINNAVRLTELSRQQTQGSFSPTSSSDSSNSRASR